MTDASAARAAKLIGVDWGTSSLRAYRLGDAGDLLDERVADGGIMTVKDGDFERALLDIAGDWFDTEDCPAILSGMITSRQGWIELPYVSCPTGKRELCSALHRHTLASGRHIYFATGVTTTGRDGVPDVMRGEETQILGAMRAGWQDGLFVLPGTHSKWVRAGRGQIIDFATFMTGELFSVLRRHSILGRMMDGDAHDQAAFVRGVAYGRAAEDASGGLLKRLFGTRALGLFGTVERAGAASHLSGLLIGTETREALGLFGDGGERTAVTVLGQSELVDLYLVALGQFGVEALPGPENAAALGLLSLAEAAGLTEVKE